MTARRVSASAPLNGLVLRARARQIRALTTATATAHVSVDNAHATMASGAMTAQSCAALAITPKIRATIAVDTVRAKRTVCARAARATLAPTASILACTTNVASATVMVSAASAATVSPTRARPLTPVVCAAVTARRARAAMVFLVPARSTISAASAVVMARRAQ